MRAKATNIFKPKSEKAISTDFKKKYKLPYYNLEDTYKQLKEFGVDVRLNKHDQRLQLFNWEIYMVDDDYGKEKLIGEVWTREHANKIIRTINEMEESVVSFYTRKSDLGISLSLANAIDILEGIKKAKKN